MSLTRTTVTDDDGTGTTGSLWNAAQRTADWDVVDSRWSRVTITSTGTQNNLSISEADFVVFNNATDLTINGIVAPASPSKPGKPFRFVCIGAGNVFFAHQNAGSTAANRFVNIAASGNTPFSAGTSSQAGGRGCYVYDDVNSRWQLVLHEQGAWIARTFAGGNFAGDGTITWTVDAGDVVADRYLLRGATLLWNLSLSATSTGGAASSQLRATIPGGFKAAARVIGPAWELDNSSQNNGLYDTVAAANTYVAFLKGLSGNWSNAAANTTAAMAAMQFDVQ